MKQYQTFLFACLLAVLATAGVFQDVARAQETAGAPVSAQPTVLDLFERASTALENGIVSEKTLELLRRQLVEVRDSNAIIVAEGSIEAETLAAQLRALGPQPEGQDEPAEIAERRRDLTNALAAANAPIREAREITNLANVLIREADRQIRARKIESLLTRYPSPVFPSTWSSGWQEIEQFRQRLNRDIQAELARPSVSKALGETVPVALGLIAFGLLFLLVLRHPIHRILLKISLKQEPGVRAVALAVVYNLSILLLPVIGALALLLVIPVLDIYPNAARIALTATPVVALVMVIANWLGHTLFAPEQTRWRLLELEEREAKLGLRLCQGLGVFMMLEVVLEALQLDNAFGEAAISAMSVPLIAMAAVLLWALAGTLRNKRADAVPGPGEGEDVEDGEEVDEASVKPQESGFLFFLSLLMKASAVLAVTVTLAGYVQLARAAIIPMIMTVAQLGLGFMLYHLSQTLVKAATNRDEAAPAPILVSIALVLALVAVFAPLIALTWGARATDIADAWRLLVNGVQFGDIRLSLDSLIVLAVVFSLGVFITRWLKNLLRRSVLPQTRMDSGAQTAIVTGTGYVGLTLAALIAVSTAGLNLSSLAVVAGALSVGIGFGLQTIVSNFVSGIILLIERPIKEGDWIEVSGQSGYVRKISVRSTRIETFDRHDVIIPNSDLIAGTVRNMTLSNKSGRLLLPVRVAYGSDLEKVKSILIDAARGHFTIARYPAPFVLFSGLGESALNFELRCYLKDVNNILTTKSDLYFTIYNELGKAGIEIPFPQQDLHVKDIDKLLALLERKQEAGPTPAS
ncbi:DUF3772 domain-containing protein [Labrenzia sp. VG12]|uniref:DUF3772 domain-containing protein n=1 Tax=Labrenzia sp. VG12 TaxID=2021862 RepID=UPI000B8C47C8|nr:DUF3772 domain-containing protein [Labrenzia sp. VG12]ASP36746.1 mechanosensitive ion channel protein [Labrenzia sp. VG12]